MKNKLHKHICKYQSLLHGCFVSANRGVRKNMAVMAELIRFHVPFILHVFIK